MYQNERFWPCHNQMFWWGQNQTSFWFFYRSLSSLVSCENLEFPLQWESFTVISKMTWDVLLSHSCAIIFFQCAMPLSLTVSRGGELHRLNRALPLIVHVLLYGFYIHHCAVGSSTCFGLGLRGWGNMGKSPRCLVLTPKWFWGDVGDGGVGSARESTVLVFPLALFSFACPGPAL